MPIFTPAACVSEAQEYLPDLCSKRGRDVPATLGVLDTLFTLVKVVDQSFYVDFEDAAKRRIGARDPEDWPVLALALALQAPIWTEDTDFFGSGVATWTTDTVELYLSEDPWQINDAPSEKTPEHFTNRLFRRCGRDHVLRTNATAICFNPAERPRKPSTVAVMASHF